jgi:hypothetical protein
MTYSISTCWASPCVVPSPIHGARVGLGDQWQRWLHVTADIRSFSITLLTAVSLCLLGYTHVSSHLCVRTQMIFESFSKYFGKSVCYLGWHYKGLWLLSWYAFCLGLLTLREPVLWAALRSKRLKPSANGSGSHLGAGPSVEGRSSKTTAISTARLCPHGRLAPSTPLLGY